LNQLKKGIGMLGAILTGVVLVLSLAGSGPPGCGAVGGDTSDACETACQNTLNCRVSSSSSSGSSGSSGSSSSSGWAASSSSSGSELSQCAESCRRSLSSGSSSSGGDYNALVECIARAPSCSAIQLCGVGSSSSSGSGSY
jgi:hypothetical protein